MFRGRGVGALAQHDDAAPNQRVRVPARQGVILARQSIRIHIHNSIRICIQQLQLSYWCSDDTGIGIRGSIDDAFAFVFVFTFVLFLVLLLPLALMLPEGVQFVGVVGVAAGTDIGIGINIGIGVRVLVRIGVFAVAAVFAVAIALTLACWHFCNSVGAGVRVDIVCKASMIGIHLVPYCKVYFKILTKEGTEKTF